jgi:polysaccharide biosynthesis transport protein
MTTLPQTTPLRLPRPAPSAPLAIPGGPMPHGGMVAQTQGGTQMSGADVWRVIRSNLWLIILLGIVSSAAGYGANSWLQRYHSKYTAIGTLVVASPTFYTDNNAANPMSNVDLPSELKTHATMLKDAGLITQVLQNPDNEIHTTIWYRTQPSAQDAKQNLADNLDIGIPPDSRLLRLSMTCNDPKSAQVIVNSIAEQYIKNQKELNENREYDRSRDLNGRKVREELGLKSVETEIASLESELNESGVTGSMNKISAKDIELSQLLQSSLAMQLKLGEAQDIYANIESQINADQDPPKVAEMVATDPDVSSYRTSVSNLEMLIGEQESATGEDNPSLVRLKAHMQLLQRKLSSATADARIRYRTEIAEAAKEDVVLAQRSLDQMTSEINALKGDMAHLTDLMTRLLERQSEKDAYDIKLKQINDQLDQIMNYAARHDITDIDWAAKPELPEAPSFPKLGITMTLAVSLGLCLALGIAFLREFLDTSIRSPRDITRVGNMNVLGMVPHEDDDPQSAGARLPVVIFEAPHSMMAEQLRQVRTRLQHSSSLDTIRSLLVTSPSPGDGKSTIACNLASGLALNGRRILLVDANFRRPELHRIFNLGNDQGFSDVLNNLEAFDTAIQETQVPNLYVLPCGPKPSNATELLESQLLIDFIERSLEEFDHVIFDSGPILFVSETVALAPRVDGVVTVVRARANSRGVLSRMRETLRQVKAEHLGIVLNAVRAQGGGYYGRNIRTYYEYQSGPGGGRAA